MKLFQAVLSVSAALAAATKNSSLNTTHSHRYLQEKRIMASENGGFVPLSCNRPRCKLGKTDWMTEGYDPDAGTVVIPCGKCVLMNYKEGPLILPHGLDIQGELRFPNGYKLELFTPFVRVQGRLIMRDRRSVKGDPNVKFILTGGDARVTSFVPAHDNEFACTNDGSLQAQECSVGAKAFVVAGGLVDIQGIPSNCKTWVRLEQVMRNSSFPPPKDFRKLPDSFSQSSSPCHGRAVLFHTEFSSEGDLENWSGGDAPFKRTNSGTLKVFRRTISTRHGPTLDLRDVRDCLVVDQDYLLVVRLRLLDRMLPLGGPGSCANDGTGCLAIQTLARYASGGTSHGLGKERPEDDLVNGEWRTMNFVVRFGEKVLAPDPVVHVLRFVGMHASVEIQLDHMELSLPSGVALPNPESICEGNLIQNGDASAHRHHPYPFEGNGARLDMVETRLGNRYFRVRKRDDDRAGITTYLGAPGCIQPTATFRFSVKILVKSQQQVHVKVVMRASLDSGVVEYVVASCLPSIQRWDECTSDFTIPVDFPVDRVVHIRFGIETEDAPTVSYLCDDFSFRMAHGVADAILVPSDGVDGCWDEGAEILLTSHTIDMSSSQVRRITSAPTPVGGGLTKLSLDTSIVPPISRVESEFAVEVALLSRNIAFEGAQDETDGLLGGHFIVFHTPNAAQLISGAQFINFGRQGELGRYPIHFHMCESVHGSRVEKNAIRGSNQRGIVIHGSHNVTISENVAYEVRGHTFMTEDGGEMDNVFVGNLGASTTRVERLVRPFETDRSGVSTYWISNPMNSFIGNVAAGSDENGFWFELQLVVRSPSSLLLTSKDLIPRELSLTMFKDNIAHSNRVHGLRTYPFGLDPPSQAVFHNTSSYRNRRDGVFLHNSRDLAIVGGVLADNEKQADFDRADSIEIRGTRIIGMSDAFRYVVESQRSVLHHKKSVGIEIHGFVLDRRESGAIIENVAFQGFSDTLSDEVALVKLDPDTRSSRFDYWTSVQGVTLETGPDCIFDFHESYENGVTDAFIVDIDGSMDPNPGGSASGRAGTIIVASEEMKAFLNPDACVEYSLGASAYCRHTCLRSILYSIPPTSVTSNLLLRVTSLDNGATFDYEGKFYNVTGGDGSSNEAENASFFKRRLFAAVLPNGRYTALFVDKITKQPRWPDSVEMTLEPTKCDPSIQANDVVLIQPQPQADECSVNLVKNGDMEDGLSPWLQSRGGIFHEAGSGIDGTHALSDGGSGQHNAGLGQFIDTRCLKKGLLFELRGWVRLVNRDKTVNCVSGKTCPRLFIRLWTPVDSNGSDFHIEDILVSDRLTSQSFSDSWDMLHGMITIDSRIIAASSVAVIVQKGQPGITMLLDNFSMHQYDTSCNNLVTNGDISSGDSSFWRATNGVLTIEPEEDDYALGLTQRSSKSDSLYQRLVANCFTEGERFQVTAKLRLSNSDSTLFRCDPAQRNTESSCPRIRLVSIIEEGSTRESKSHFGGSVAVTDHGLTEDGWYTVSGFFHATLFDEMSSFSTVYVIEAPHRKSLAIDDFRIHQVEQECGELLTNGDAELGSTSLFWTTHIVNGGAKIDIIPEGQSNHAFMLSNRRNNNDGISQLLDHRCLDRGSTWQFSARMKLLNGSRGVSCDPSSTRPDTRCPQVRILGHRDGVRQVEARFAISGETLWNSTVMNNYKVDIDIQDALASCDRVAIAIRSFNADWTLVVDDMSLTTRR